MKIYLAGPEVFLPNALEVYHEKKNICTEYKFIGLSPLDNVLVNEEQKGIDLAREIFKANTCLIQECDILAANCNSFRGSVIDDGTAWEIGYGFAIGKKVFGYINNYIPLVDSTRKKIITKPHESGYMIDQEGYLLNEDFGNAINLMLEFSIEESGGLLIEGGFLDCIREIRKKISCDNVN